MATIESIRAFRDAHPKEYLELERFCDKCYFHRILRINDQETCPLPLQFYYINNNDYESNRQQQQQKKVVELFIKTFLVHLNNHLPEPPMRLPVSVRAELQEILKILKSKEENDG